MLVHCGKLCVCVRGFTKRGEGRLCGGGGGGQCVEGGGIEQGVGESESVFHFRRGTAHGPGVVAVRTASRLGIPERRGGTDEL